MKIIGNLDPELARTYSYLIKSGKMPCNDGGGACQVSFMGADAVKHPYERDYSNPTRIARIRNILEDEFILGKLLREKGINVPEMRGVVLDNENPFLVMKRLNLVPVYELGREQKRIASAQYKEQRRLAMDFGFVPGDMDIAHNCGFNVKEGKLYFFDFAEWRVN